MILRCGLLGEKLGHSYSPAIHRRLGDYSYELFEKNPAELEDFIKNGEWDGINVTIPYKKSVLPYMDSVSDTVRSTGSVNTVVRRPDGTLYGDNTDVYGFTSTLLRSGAATDGCKALVLGSGGASAAVTAAMASLGVKSVIISRSGPDNYSNLERHADAEIIVNATPVGMYPNNGAAPLDLRLFPRLKTVFDLIYNPARTALMLQAEELGVTAVNGLHMLVSQAKRSAELFTGQSIDEDVTDSIEKTLSREMGNIVLIGMPGCGKTTLGGELARITGRELLDADSILAERVGMTIPEFFSKYGEEGFRKAESEVLRDIGRLSGKIIATGGGCVTVKDNYPLLHQNGTIVLINRDLSLLPKEGRPLSMRSTPEEMYRLRRPMYETFADVTIDNNGPISRTVREILEATE